MIGSITVFCCLIILWSYRWILFKLVRCAVTNILKRKLIPASTRRRSDVVATLPTSLRRMLSSWRQYFSITNFIIICCLSVVHHLYQISLHSSHSTSFYRCSFNSKNDDISKIWRHWPFFAFFDANFYFFFTQITKYILYYIFDVIFRHINTNFFVKTAKNGHSGFWEREPITSWKFTITSSYFF